MKPYDTSRDNPSIKTINQTIENIESFRKILQSQERVSINDRYALTNQTTILEKMIKEYLSRPDPDLKFIAETKDKISEYKKRLSNEPMFGTTENQIKEITEIIGKKYKISQKEKLEFAMDYFKNLVTHDFDRAKKLDPELVNKINTTRRELVEFAKNSLVEDPQKKINEINEAHGKIMGIANPQNLPADLEISEQQPGKHGDLYIVQGQIESNANTTTNHNKKTNPEIEIDNTDTSGISP